VFEEEKRGGGGISIGSSSFSFFLLLVLLDTKKPGIADPRNSGPKPLGFEPMTYGFESECATHYTTAPY